MKYPNIKAIMEGSSKEEDWENDPIVPPSGNSDEIERRLEVPSVSSDVVPSPSKPSVQTPSSANVDAEDIVIEEEMVEESDPRPHLNLVFIGHVDAGKVANVVLYFLPILDLLIFNFLVDAFRKYLVYYGKGRCSNN